LPTPIPVHHTPFDPATLLPTSPAHFVILDPVRPTRKQRDKCAGGC